MKITWCGHSAFRIDVNGKVILIDPFLTDNPSWEGGWKEIAKGATHVLLTHGHDDHIGDSVSICRETGAQLVANYELCAYLAAKAEGIETNPGNAGGTVNCDGFTTSFVRADHSSSSGTANGENVYLGNPLGLVLHFPDQPTLYHMGDTDIFGDMELIQELHEPEIGIVPIGDRFTMGGAVAALACRRYFNFKTILPCHFGTFPIIDQDASKFVEAIGDEHGSKVKVLEPGQSVEL